MTKGVVLMMVVAGCWMLLVVIGFAGLEGVEDDYERFCAAVSSEPDTAVTVKCDRDLATKATTGGMNATGIPLAVGMVVVGLFALRGHGWARVAGMVLNGVSVSMFGYMALNRLLVAAVMYAELNVVNPYLVISSASMVVPVALNLVSVFLLVHRDNGNWFKAMDWRRNAPPQWRNPAVRGD